MTKCEHQKSDWINNNNQPFRIINTNLLEKGISEMRVTLLLLRSRETTLPRLLVLPSTLMCSCRYFSCQHTRRNGRHPRLGKVTLIGLGKRTLVNSFMRNNNSLRLISIKFKVNEFEKASNSVTVTEHFKQSFAFHTVAVLVDVIH